MERLSEQRCFDGVQGFYRHEPKATGAAMSFAVYLPPLGQSAAGQAVLEHYSRQSEQRLILADLPQHHHLFRAVSRNPHLMDEAIDNRSNTLSIDALHERAWQLVQPHYLKRLAGFMETFGTARSGRSADDLGNIAEADVTGRMPTRTGAAAIYCF